MLPRTVAAALAEILGGPVRDAVAVGGGDLNEAYRVTLADGTRAFVKTSADAAPGAFAGEAAGLRWLSVEGGPAVPDVLAVDDEPGRQGCLALAWVDEGRLDGAGEAALGRGLATLHAAGADAFGALAPGTPPATGHDVAPLRLGPLTLPGTTAATCGAFMATARLLPVARLADDRGALPTGTLAALDRLCDRLDDLLGPPEPPARLHGDLWTGNVLAGRDGSPWLIDCAAYGGHRETDLAMLELFGGRREGLLAAYDEAHPLADGRDDRVALHQLFALLVHAALFGGGYGASAAAIVRRYAGR